MSPIVITQLATGLSVLAGAVFIKSVMDQKPMAGQFPRCPTCNGRAACSNCGGSGTGRPLPAQITVQPPNRPY
ncbi:unnamed protein product [Arabidopsis thaliana]|uniref:(thale cress) hypothetical protein n=1 Tax=Arabidopsis thaliana TaxID=3702 RepID=A0A7G2FHX3_ARATH|nr:unnamed protein product [Arabidopsis thaliana]